MANDIDTYEGFIAEATQALEETFEENLDVLLDDVTGYKQEMVAELENVFEKGESTLNVEYYDDGYGSPAFDYAEGLGFGILDDNRSNENIEWIDFPDADPVESARRSVAVEIAMTPMRCLRDWFETHHGRDILNESWILS